MWRRGGEGAWNNISCDRNVQRSYIILTLFLTYQRLLALQSCAIQNTKVLTCHVFLQSLSWRYEILSNKIQISTCKHILMFPLRWAKQLPLKCQVDVRWRRDGTTLHIFLSESPQNIHGSGIRRIELFLINTNNIYIL